MSNKINSEKNTLKKEIAAGGIISIFNNQTQSIDILLVHTKSYNGYWGFPKGHVEKNENLIETAIREIKEETGLDVVLASNNLKWTSNYQPFSNVQKTVTYFWFQPKNELNIVVIPQVKEISQIIWVDYGKVKDFLTYKNDKDIFDKFIDETSIKKFLKK
ncbi:bis(5'-nucleosyl)-tetraphosphatase [Mycoplasmoides alvi]|uniref:bis(5'-nucleosyl)-tetraphosphatase n=1 Tax=Mycoplasmoides alvi TaxID=78580 RepID=UPI000696C008|nr:NUDIX domain-containing protein [Mycoplasmoides alvi]